MAIKVTLKNSVVQDSVPTTSHLAAVGELALNANINSLGIYMRASDNSIVKMAGPGSVTTPAASTTVAGIAELATSAETTTGTDTARVTTPAGVKAVTDAERTTSNNTYLALAGGTLTGVVAATAGSNSAPAIHFGDSDSGVFGGTNTVSLTAGGTTRLTADTGVSVVGTLAVTGGITSTSDLTIADKVIHAGDTDTAIRFPAANTVSVESGGSEALRVDSSQRLLVGLTSARAIANLTTLQQIEGTDAASGLSITRNSASNEGGTLNFGKSRAAGIGGVTVIQDGDALGTINFSGADGTDLTNTAASIAGFINGTPGANDTPGKLVFGTTADGGTSPTTRLTITSAGVVNVPDNGKFTAGASDDLQIFHDGTGCNIRSTSSKLEIRSPELILQNSAAEKYIRCVSDERVELYYDNTKKFETTSGGAQIENGTGNAQLNIRGGSSDGTATIQFVTDDNADNNDNFRLISNASNAFYLQNYANGAWQTNIKAIGGGGVEIEHNNSKKFETSSTGITVTGKLNFDSDNYLDCNTTANTLEIFLDGGQVGEFGAASLKLLDDKILKLGTGNDLQIYHDGSESHIHDDGTGSLRLRSNAFKVMNAANNEAMIYANENGAVELYYDNVLRLATTGGGIDVAGSGSFTSHIDINSDSGKLRLGNANDLELYHDGSNSYVKNNTGILLIDGTEVQIRANGTEDAIKCHANGNVELYYDNSKKLETNTGGVKVTGTLRMDDGSTTTNRLVLGTGGDFLLFHDGSVNIIDIYANLEIKHGNEKLAAFATDGQVELYYDNDKVFETVSYGAVVKRSSGGSTVFEVIGPEGNAAEINLKADDGDDNADRWKLKADHVASGFYIQDYSTGSYADNIRCFGGGAVELYYDGSKKLETTDYGAAISGQAVVSANKAAGYALSVINDGASFNRYGIVIQCGQDSPSTQTNYSMTFTDGDGSNLGYIKFTSAGLVYDPFTAAHHCIVPDTDNPSDNSMAYPYGTLLEIIEVINTDRNLKYKVQKTQTANSKKVLGAYGGSMNGGPSGETNLHDALILGDGHILVNNAGGNIEVGDGICSSATAGIGQKATANPSMIIGIAQEAITFTGSETKLVAVQYGLQQFIPWT